AGPPRAAARHGRMVGAGLQVGGAAGAPARTAAADAALPGSGRGCQWRGHGAYGLPDRAGHDGGAAVTRPARELWTLGKYLAFASSALTVLLTIVLTAVIEQTATKNVAADIGTNLAELAGQT